MRKIALLLCLCLAAFSGKSQNITVSNTSCQIIGVVVVADFNCNATYGSQVYYLNPGAGLKLSMYPGGPYPAVNWSSPIPAGLHFTLVKVFEPRVMLWAQNLYHPCWGLSSSFGPQPGCGAQGTSIWPSPSTPPASSFVTVNIF